MVFLLTKSNKIIAIILVCLLSLTSCFPIANFDENGFNDYIDPGVKMSRGEFKENLTAHREKKEEDDSDFFFTSEEDEAGLEPKIPEINPILAAPKAPDFNNDKLVSLSVTEDIPIKDVLIELGRIGDIDMEIDPAISGGIILRVKNKPFKQVIERVADLGGLRFTEKDGIIRVESDSPYLVNYNVDFLNLVRSNSGSVTVDTKVLGGDSGGGSEGGSSGGGLSSGSSSALTAEYDGDLWTSIENSLQSILAFIPTSLSSNSINTVNLDSTVTSSMSAYTINKQAGVISVMAPMKQQKNVSEYLTKLQRSVSAQVLIESKILEVALDEEYRSGIDWGTITDTTNNFSLSGSFDSGITGTDFLKVSRLSPAGTIKQAASLVDKFGTSRTLSSPRVHAMNNQQAVLTFAENNVYFTIDLETEEEESDTGQTTTTVTVDSTLNTVPIGVILTLQPSINLDTEEITMNIRPTLSRITQFTSDPAVDFLKANSTQNLDIKSEIPVVEVREMDSVLKIKSGQVMVIGGLMREASINDDSGVPGASKIPMFGHFFKSTQKQSETVETVIFIKATIVNSNGLVGARDKEFYNNFSADPRPLAF